MGLLDYSVRRGISRAVGTVAEDKILEAVAPKAKENIAKNQSELNAAAAGLASVAERAAGSGKICPGCGELCAAEKKFCPSCGTALPERREEKSACADCGQPLSPGAKFCSGCGALVVKRCPGCGKEQKPGVKFCGQCGTHLE